MTGVHFVLFIHIKTKVMLLAFGTVTKNKNDLLNKRESLEASSCERQSSGERTKSLY